MDEAYVVLVHCPNRKDVEKGFDTYDEALKYMGIMGKPQDGRSLELLCVPVRHKVSRGYKEHEKRMKEMKDEP